MDRFFASLKLLVTSWFNERLFGYYPYIIKSFNAARQTIDASPVTTGQLPFVQGLQIRSPGLQFVCQPGEQCIVAFEGGLPTKPFIAALGLAAEYGSALPIARQGDMIRFGGNGQLAAFYPTGTPPVPPVVTLGVPYLISFGTLVPPSPPTPPPIQSPGYGIISTGSVAAKTR